MHFQITLLFKYYNKYANAQVSASVKNTSINDLYYKHNMWLHIKSMMCFDKQLTH